jgi:hypothetical protein
MKHTDISEKRLESLIVAALTGLPPSAIGGKPVSDMAALGVRDGRSPRL